MEEFLRDSPTFPQNQGFNNINEQGSHSVSVLYLNAQSIVNKINELNCVTNDKQPDIVCICEAWTKEEITNAFLGLPNYNLICRSDRKDTKKGVGGGLLIYVKTELNVSELNSEYLNDFNQCAAISLKVNKEIFNICLVYCPHNLYDCNDVNENNLKLCEVLKKLPKPFIIVGDFNFSDIDWQSGKYTAKSKDFVECVQNSFLTQHIDFPTH